MATFPLLKQFRSEKKIYPPGSLRKCQGFFKWEELPILMVIFKVFVSILKMTISDLIHPNLTAGRVTRFNDKIAESKKKCLWFSSIRPWTRACFSDLFILTFQSWLIKLFAKCKNKVRDKKHFHCIQQWQCHF